VDDPRRCLKGYELSQLQDAFSRYIPPSEAREPRDANSGEGLSPISQVLGGGTPRASKNHLKASADGGSRTLADGKGGIGGVPH